MSHRNVTAVYACERDVTEDIAYGKYQLVFISPETGSDCMMIDVPAES